MLNKAILIGRLGRDPETRNTQSGGSVVSFSMATTETWRDKQSGERKEKSEWHNIVIWNEGIGKVAEQYLKKGSMAYVEGQIQTREYTDKEGVKRKTIEIVLQKFRGELRLLNGKNASQGGDDSRGETKQSSGGGSTSRSAPMDDDIPF